jgi:acyl-CoA reductase LuxC
MPEALRWFLDSAGERLAVALPLDPDALIADWCGVRRAMRRALPDPFTRDEWGHLMSALEERELRRPFASAFGSCDRPGAARALLRPRGEVVVWLPNNVTLLGPLITVLISLTGAPLLLKVGTRAEDLTTRWVEWLREHAPAGTLREWLHEYVEVVALEREDARNHELAQRAAVRIAFGMDETIATLESLPHPPTSVGFAFGSRDSEAWIEIDRATDEVLGTLIRVFAIFGQAGCTSPRRAVLLGADAEQALTVRDRLVELWPGVASATVPMHIASANVAATQHAAAAGWAPVCVEGHRAVVAAGAPELHPTEGVQSLFVVAADLERAIATAPRKLQTIGHAVGDAEASRWLHAVLRTGAKRFVPLGGMHRFGAVWDGFAFWRGLFEQIEIAM